MVKKILDCEQSQQLFLRGQMNIRRRNAKHIGEVQDSVRLGWSPLKKGHNARCAAVNSNHALSGCVIIATPANK